MYVDESHRSKGIATALVKRLLCEFAKDNNIHAARLEVNADQKLARQLYEHFGFRKVGLEAIVFGDGLSHEAIIMERELASNT
jgi:ribosomal protein S18 acetylase RimI-like enzyme